MKVKFETHKNTKLFTAVIALTLWCSVGSKASNELQHDLEAANLKKAIYCMELLEVKLDVDTAESECFGDTYTQHSPHVADGKEIVLQLFRNRAKRFPQFTARIVRSAASGDLVWLHMHTQRTPDDLGRAVVNIFRMENGKLVEHWNVVQAVPETSRNENGMF